MNKPIGTGWEIDWGHPLARGLVSAPVANADGSIYDLVQKAFFTIRSDMTMNVSNGVEAIHFGNTSTSDAYLDINAINTVDGLTIITEFNLDSDSGLGQSLFSLTKIGSSLDYIRLTAQTNVAGNPIRAQVKRGSSATIDTGSIPFGSESFAAVVFAASNLLEVYSGDDYASLSHTVTGGQVGRINISNWFDDDYVNQPLNGNISAGYIFNRPLSSAEIYSLHENPYQFLKQRKSIDTNELSTLLAPMPTANDDTDTVDRGVSDTVTGNVLTNDDITCP